MKKFNIVITQSASNREVPYLKEVSGLRVNWHDEIQTFVHQENVSDKWGEWEETILSEYTTGSTICSVYGIDLNCLEDKFKKMIVRFGVDEFQNRIKKILDKTKLIANGTQD